MIFRIVHKDLILILAWLPKSYGTSNNLLLSLCFVTEEMGMIVQPQSFVRMKWGFVCEAPRAVVPGRNIVRVQLLVGIVIQKLLISLD